RPDDDQGQQAAAKGRHLPQLGQRQATAGDDPLPCSARGTFHSACVLTAWPARELGKGGEITVLFRHRAKCRQRDFWHIPRRLSRASVWESRAAWQLAPCPALLVPAPLVQYAGWYGRVNCPRGSATHGFADRRRQFGPPPVP